MFKFLENIDIRLYERYLTVERNIKAASNSFYDAYLDMQEQFVKLVCERFDIDVSVHESCGAILKKDIVKDVFTKKLNVDDYTYNKMQDYTLKVNAHKHKGEKHIQIETIVSYMRVIYYAVVSFVKYFTIDFNDFDAQYFIDIFGCYEKENISLKEQVVGLKEELQDSVVQHKLKDSDLETFKSLLSQSEIEKMSLEDQNRELQKQVSKLKDIKISSMEEKLNKALDMLVNLNDEIQENRVATDAVYRSITGGDIKTAIKRIKDNG